MLETVHIVLTYLIFLCLIYFHPITNVFTSIKNYIIQLIPKGGNVVESTSYIGILVLIMAIYGFIKRRREVILWSY